MYKPKNTFTPIIIVILAFTALASIFYSFNEARKLAVSQALQDEREAELKNAKDRLDLENKRLKEIRAKSYLVKISKEQYLKTKYLVDQTNIFFRAADSLNPEIILKTKNTTIEKEINTKRLKINLLLKTWNDNNENSIETNQDLINQIKTAVLFIQAYMSQLQMIVSDLTTDENLTTEEINSYHQLINSGINQIIEVMTIINQTETIINDPTNPLNQDTDEINEQIEVIHQAEKEIQELENIPDINTNTSSTTSPIIDSNLPITSTSSVSTSTKKRPRIVNPEPTIIYQINPAPYRDTGVDVDDSQNLNTLQDW